MIPEMFPIRSSAITMAGYDPVRRTLAIAFSGGNTYLYEGVPPQLYALLLRADSKGTFVNTRIKPFHPARRV